MRWRHLKFGRCRVGVSELVELLASMIFSFNACLLDDSVLLKRKTVNSLSCCVFNMVKVAEPLLPLLKCIIGTLIIIPLHQGLSNSIIVLPVTKGALGLLNTHSDDMQTDRFHILN